MQILHGEHLVKDLIMIDDDQLMKKVLDVLLFKYEISQRWFGP